MDSDEEELPSFEIKLQDENLMPNKRVKQMTTEELQKNIEQQKSKNTERSTKTALNTWKSWCETTGETRKIEEIPKEELNQLLKHFYWEIRKTNGEDFEPGSLRTIQRGLDRQLLRNEVGFSIIRDEVFKTSNEALSAKLKALKKDGKGNKPNAAEALTDEVIEKLWQTGALGVHSGEALTNANFLNISQHFGFRGRQEHHQLKFGDVEIITTNGQKCVQWSVERLRKILDNDRRFNPKMWATGHAERCPVMLYEEYVANRPAEMCQKDSPFWLAINYRATNGKVLKSQKMGEKKIDTLIKSMVTGLPEAKGHRLTNHSNRKTTIENLLKNKVERSDIAQLTGHRNLKSIDSYASAPLETQKEMSSITSKHCSSVESMSESTGSSSSTMQVAATSTNTISFPSASHMIPSLFGGSKFENSTITINIQSK